MPFAHNPGLVASLLQQHRKCRQVGIYLLNAALSFRVAGYAINIGKTARKDGCSGRGAKRISAESVLKKYSRMGQSIQIWCADQWISSDTQLMVGVIIGHDKKDVWARSLNVRPQFSGGKTHQQSQAR